MDLDLAKAAVDLATAGGATYAEARLEHDRCQEFLIKKGIPEGARSYSRAGAAIRVVIGKGLGFSSTNILNRDGLRAAVDLALRNAKMAALRGPERPALAEAPVLTGTWAKEVKMALDEVSLETKIDHLLAEDSAIPQGDDVVGRMLSYRDTVTTRLFVNSDGAEIRQELPRAVLWATLAIKGVNGSEMSGKQLGATGGFEDVLAWDTGAVMTREVEMLRKVLAGGGRAPTTPTTVIVGPEIAGIAVHESCGHPQEADRILGREGAQAGESYLSRDSMGFQMGSEEVNIADDPSIEGTYGYYAVDAEGVKARDRDLVTAGKVSGFLLDRGTAAELGTESNGAARAQSFDREPLVRMSNTYVRPGDHTFAELLEGISEGVYIATFTEWNIDDRRYHQKYVGKEAYMIRNGELAEPLRRPTIECTTPTFWRAVSACGKEIERSAGTCGKGEPMQAVPATFGGPHLRLEDFRLAA